LTNTAKSIEMILFSNFQNFQKKKDLIFFIWRKKLSKRMEI